MIALPRVDLKDNCAEISSILFVVQVLNYWYILMSTETFIYLFNLINSKQATYSTRQNYTLVEK